MSMNISIRATRDILILKTKVATTQTIYFDCWQTPTNITYEIIAKDDPISGYKEWVLSSSADEVSNIYAADDWDLAEPIGTEIVNNGQYHVTELEEWISSNEQAGYNIEIYYI